MNTENSKTPNEELGRMKKEDYHNAEKIPLIVILDNVRSLNNVGSIFRTCDAFRVESSYLCGHTGTPPNKEISKTALGATDTVEWKYFKGTLESINYLRERNFKIYAIEQTKNSIMLDKMNLESSEKIALIFGNEVYGVDQEIINISDASIEIPQYGSKHSLNVSVSAGIVLWEVSKKYFNS
jgi:23S rRNA (guanosine2251-2'-O)-methyltransferase